MVIVLVLDDITSTDVIEPILAFSDMNQAQMTTKNLVFTEACTSVWSRSQLSYCKVMSLRDLFI